MKITDMLALATKGYSVEDIKSVNELSKNTPEVLELAKTGLKVSDLNALVELADAGEPEPDAKKHGSEDPESAETPDYKALYEEEKKKAEELQTTVSKIQKDNAGKNVAGNKQEPDIIDTITTMLNECT